MVKKAENFWKGLSHNRAQISPIPPEAYGERFIHFIEGITMSKDEAERLQQARAKESTSQDMTRSSQGLRRESVERTMQAAEKEAHRSGPEPPARTLSTTWDPSDIHSISGPSTLPIVEEAGEAASQKSGRSRGARSPPQQSSSFSEMNRDTTPSPKANGRRSPERGNSNFINSQ
jgi:1-phosphatidylinositol-4-phosphate 5-kinase